MTNRVRVASKAVRRGRQLRTRTSIPPAPQPEPQVVTKPPVAADDEATPLLSSRYSRPPAPMLDLRPSQIPRVSAPEIEQRPLDPTRQSTFDLIDEQVLARCDKAEDEADDEDENDEAADMREADLPVPPESGEQDVPRDDEETDEPEDELDEDEHDEDEHDDDEPEEAMSGDTMPAGLDGPARLAAEEVRRRRASDRPPESHPAARSGDLLGSSGAGLHTSELGSSGEQFFELRRKDDFELLDDAPASEGAPPLTQEQIERRANMRRYVTIGIGAAALIGVGLLAKSLFKGEVAHAERHAATAAMAATESPTAAPVAPTAAPVTEPVAADPIEAAGISEDDYEALADHTVELLSDRRLAEAEVFAAKLIQLRPEDAFGYRCLGASLQDQNKIKEARAVYSDCVRNAKHGDVYECGALGGKL